MNFTMQKAATDSYIDYDFTSLISVEENKGYCDFLEKYILDGGYDKDPDHWPKYQTDTTRFFDYKELTNLKMSFLYSAFAFLGGPVNMVDLKSWALMSKPDMFRTLNGGWHHHDQYQEYGCISVLSGIYYARVNDHREGTRFREFVIDPSERHWYIYPGTLEHTTNKVVGPEWRMLFVADLLYK
mgnify:CR=1 FL=1